MNRNSHTRDKRTIFSLWLCSSYCCCNIVQCSFSFARIFFLYFRLCRPCGNEVYCITKPQFEFKISLYSTGKIVDGDFSCLSILYLRESTTQIRAIQQAVRKKVLTSNYNVTLMCFILYNEFKWASNTFCNEESKANKWKRIEY